MTAGDVLRVLTREPRKKDDPTTKATPNYRRIKNTDRWERAPGWFTTSEAGRQ